MTQSLEVRTALLLRTEMRILRDNKMRPLFQEAIVTELAVPKSTTRYQMKATDIIFPIIPHESQWVSGLDTTAPESWGYFQNKLKP